MDMSCLSALSLFSLLQSSCERPLLLCCRFMWFKLTPGWAHDPGLANDLFPHTLATGQPWTHGPTQHAILGLLITQFRREISFCSRISYSTNDASLDLLGSIIERTSWRVKSIHSQKIGNQISPWLNPSSYMQAYLKLFPLDCSDTLTNILLSV